MSETGSICTECGIRIYRHTQSQHRRSLIHRHHEFIRSMWGQPSVTLNYFARRFDITQERVRQLSVAMGLPSLKQYHRQQRIVKWRSSDRLLRKLEATCQAEGLVMGPHLPNGTRHIRTRLVEVNGYRCTLHHTHKTADDAYFCLHRLRRLNGIDFCLHDCGAIGWVVVPASKMAKYKVSTLCVIGRDYVNYKLPTVDWNQYLNEWEPLKGARS